MIDLDATKARLGLATFGFADMPRGIEISIPPREPTLARAVCVPYPGSMGEAKFPEADYGWGSTFPTFNETPAPEIRDALASFIRDVSAQQLLAWDESIEPLQNEVGEVLRDDPSAGSYSAILEYQLPL